MKSVLYVLIGLGLTFLMSCLLALVVGFVTLLVTDFIIPNSSWILPIALTLCICSCLGVEPKELKKQDEQ